MKTRSAAWRSRRPASLFLGAAVMAMMLALSGCGGEATNKPAGPAPVGSQAKSPPSTGADTEGDTTQSESEPSVKEAQPEEYRFIAELEKAINSADLDKLRAMMSEDLFSDIGEDVKRAREEGKTLQCKMVPLSVADGPGHRIVRVRNSIAVDGKIVETEELVCHITKTDEGFYLKDAQAFSADRPAERPEPPRYGEEEAEGPADIEFLERLENALNRADLDAMRAMLPDDVFRDLGREVQSAREKGETLKYKLKPIAGDVDGTRSVLRVDASLTVDGDKQGPDELLFHFIKENGKTRLEKVERADGERVGGDTADGPDEGPTPRHDGPPQETSLPKAAGDGDAELGKTEVARLPRQELKKFAGDWTAHIKPMDVDLALRADARELSGVFRFRGKSIDITETKADSDSLTFLVPIHPSGKIDGDTLVFELELKDGKLVGTMREKKHPLDQTMDVTWSRKP